MQILATEDISDELLQTLCSGLQNDFGEVTDDGRYSFKSTDAPSWIRLVAEADFWMQMLAAGGALYVAEIVKEAAKESWKSRAKIVASAVKTGGEIKKLALAIASFKRAAREETQVVIALPQPHEYFGTQLHLTAVDPDILELELALFAHYLPAVTALIKTNEENGRGAATGYFLALVEDGSLNVFWFDHESLKKMENIISIAHGAI